MGYKEVGRRLIWGQSLPVTSVIWAILETDPLLLHPLGENDNTSPQIRWFVY